MKKLIVYDSQYGNTEVVARAMAEAIGAELKRTRFGGVSALELGNYDLLIVGSPTQQGKELDTINMLLDTIPDESLKHTKVAAFDTRHAWRWVKMWGYAAPRIATTLKVKGGELIAPPEGFIVKSTKGPLLEGEINRCTEWAKTLLNSKSL